MSIKISDFHVGTDAVVSVLKISQQNGNKEQLTDPIIVPVKKVGTKYVTIDYGGDMRFSVPDWKEEPFYLTAVNEVWRYVLFRDMNGYKRLANRIANIHEIQDLKNKLHIHFLDTLSDDQLDIILNAYRKIYLIEREKNNG